MAMNADESYGYMNGELREGAPASFLLFDADDVGDLIRERPAPRYVFRGGRLIAETQPAVTTLQIAGGRLAYGNAGKEWTNILPVR
ncbi:cytosine deaminase [compost metagenome]